MFYYFSYGFILCIAVIQQADFIVQIKNLTVATQSANIEIFTRSNGYITD